MLLLQTDYAAFNHFEILPALIPTETSQFISFQQTVSFYYLPRIRGVEKNIQCEFCLPGAYILFG